MHKLARCSSWHRLQLVSLGMLDPGSSLLPNKTLHLPPASQALGVPNLALACLPTFSTPQLSTQDNFSSFRPGAPLPAAQPLGPVLPQTWPAAVWHLCKRTRSNRDCSELQQHPACGPASHCGTTQAREHTKHGVCLLAGLDCAGLSRGAEL